MSIAEITEGSGSGTLGYRLEIEGWPCFFVSDSTITWGDGADGRVQVVGLQYSELQSRERIVPWESKLQCGGMSFKIVPQYFLVEGARTPTDDCIRYLSREGVPVDQLAIALPYNSGSAPTIQMVNGTWLSAGDVFHVGTEAIRFNGEGYDRAIWGTHTQSHPVSTYDTGHNVYVYTFPPTMEGRRARLYAYSFGDDMDDDGTIVWRGIVAEVPSLNADGISWKIDCDAIPAVLRQDIAGAITEAHVVGIHHHRWSPFVVWVKFGGIKYGPFKYTTWHASEEDMFGHLASVSPPLLGTGLTDFFEDCIVDEAGATTFFDSIQVGRTNGGVIGLKLTRSSDAEEEFVIKGGSVLIGFFDSENEGFVSSSSSVVFRANVLDPGETYFIPFDTSAAFAVNSTLPNHEYQGAPCTALGDPRQLIKPKWRRHFQDSSTLAISDFPPWRIYIDADFTGVTAVQINGTNKMSGLFAVAATGTDGGTNYIDIEPTTGLVTTGLAVAANQSFAVDMLGFLGADTTITAIRQYAVGTIGDFVAALKVVSRDSGNSGDAPFIVDPDIADFSPFIGDNALALFRNFTFASKTKLLDLLVEDLKFIGYFLRLNAEGTMEAVPLPLWTAASEVDLLHTITDADILTPPFGPEPGWAPNKDGRPTEVELQHAWDGLAKEHRDAPVLVRDGSAIPITKARGVAPLEIKPLSQPGGTFPRTEEVAHLVSIGRRVLAFCGGQYDVVTFSVPYTKHGILCGDIVSVTHRRILSGDGTKGVSGRLGMVIEKHVNYDPKRKDRIALTVMLTGRNVVGYPPSAVAATAINTSGDTWTLTVPYDGMTDAGLLNRLFAPLDDSGAPTSPLNHFPAGSFVRIFLGDTYTVDEYTGEVLSCDPDSDEITIALDSTWAPSLSGDNLVDLWLVEFQKDDTDGDLSSEYQKRYAYVASDALELPGGDFARRKS